jgi:hypothetical protein
MLSSVTGLVSGLVGKVTGAFSNIAESIGNVVNGAWNWGANLVSGFADGIRSGIGKVGSAVNSVARHAFESATIDAQDNIHITMVNYSDFNLYYTKGKAGAWSPWELLFSGTDANGSDIAADSTGKPYIVIARGTELSLFIKDGVWSSRQISSMTDNIQPNLHISAEDKLYISWGQAPTQGYNNQQIFGCKVCVIYRATQLRC